MSSDLANGGVWFARWWLLRCRAPCVVLSQLTRLKLDTIDKVGGDDDGMDIGPEDELDDGDDGLFACADDSAAAGALLSLAELPLKKRALATMRSSGAGSAAAAAVVADRGRGADAGADGGSGRAVTPRAPPPTRVSRPVVASVTPAESRVAALLAEYEARSWPASTPPPMAAETPPMAATVAPMVVPTPQMTAPILPNAASVPSFGDDYCGVQYSHEVRWPSITVSWPPRRRHMCRAVLSWHTNKSSKDGALTLKRARSPR